MTAVTTPTALPLGGIVPSDVENIPVYPGARNITVDTRKAPQERTTIFTTSDDQRAVANFYEAYLRPRGWVTFSDLFHLPVRVPIILGYQWADKTGNALWKLSFGIEPFTDSSFHIYVDRWPDASKLPIYPGAQQVSVQQETPQPNVKETTVSLVTPATSAQVEAYYMKQMLEYGWQVDVPDPVMTPEAGQEKDPGSKQALYFSYRYGGVENIYAYLGASVIINSAVGGLTQVEIKAGGTDETTRYWRQLWGVSK